MKYFYKALILLLFMSPLLSLGQGGASSCGELQANFEQYQSCATNIPFENSINNTSGETFNTSCIEEQFHGPTWFFMQIKASGDIDLEISQVTNSGEESDVDFVLWGPFNTLDNVCAQLNQTKEVDCSWSAAGIEAVTLPNGVAGQLYVLLVDNYSNIAGQITITQTGGTGSSDCSFLSSVEIKDTAGDEITQLNYCIPNTKDIVATVKTSDFDGSPADLRFNYKWYKDGILIYSITDSTSSTNTLTVSETGTYLMEMTAYDSTDITIDLNNLPVSTDEIQLTFSEAPDVTLQASTTPCLSNNPVLQVVDNNTQAQIYTYQWFLNNNLITGAVASSFTPTTSGNYFVRVSNPSCPPFDSNIINIYQTPQVSISNTQTICETDSYQITSQITNIASLTNVSYQWLKDGNLISGAVNSTYTVSVLNQNANTTSVYSLQVTEQGLCSAVSNNVNVTINAKPAINTTPVPLQQCDYILPNNDGIAVTNLTQAYNAVTNNNNQFILSYFLDAALTQPIANPAAFINTTPNQTIYVTGILQGQVPACQSDTATILLTVSPTNVVNYPDIPAVCPELNNNFGFVDFESQRALIKNTYFPVSNVTIDFYISDTDAAVEQNALNNLSQIPVGTSTVYTRVELGNNCFQIGIFDVEIYSAPIQSIVSDFNACQNDTVLLVNKDNESLAGQPLSVQASYFHSFDDAKNNSSVIPKNAAVNLSPGANPIFVRLYDNAIQCFSIVDFQIDVFLNPSLIIPDPISICGNTTAIFDLNIRIPQITENNTNLLVTFYETENELIADNPIVNTNQYESGTRTIFVKIVDPTNNNCPTRTTLSLNVLESPGNTVNPPILQTCDDTGFHAFDLTQHEVQMAGMTPINDIEFRYYIDADDAEVNANNFISEPEAFTNTESTYQKIYVRLNSKINLDSETGLACYRVLEQELFIRPFPKNNLNNYSYKICVDINNNVVSPAIVDAGLPEGNYDFIWYNGFDAVAGNDISFANGNTFTTPDEGEYSVRITDLTNMALCATVANFTTRNTVVPFSLEADPVELVAFESDNTITAIVTPLSEDFEYMLDNTPWQDSNVFTAVKEGIYTLTVRNKYGCGELSTMVVVVDYPRFFTPNGDGYNDKWNIGGRVGLDISDVFIFDKYGKLIKEIVKDESGWDGTYNGKSMPSDDYWFRINFMKNGVKSEFLGHFALKR